MIRENNLFKKAFLPILIIVLFGFVYLLPFFRNEFYITHDSEPQVARSAAVYKALLDGQVPPRWAGDLNFYYGVPSPNFFFPLMGYLMTIIHLMGFSLETSYKIIMGSAFVLSGVTFYLWISQRFNPKIAFASALFYMLAPYHFLDVFVRGQLGEMLAFTFAPLVLYSIDKNSKNNTVLYIGIGALFYAFLVISHNILALLFSIIFGSYILFFNLKKGVFIKNVMLIGLGLILSFYFWAPALFEGKYINSKTFISDFYNGNFLAITDIVYSPWGFGSNINEPEGLAPQLGILYATLILVSIVGLGNRKIRKKIIFWLGILIFSVFFSTQYSGFIWEQFHMIQQFQFPWRFMAIASFSSVVLSAYAFGIIKKNWIIYPAILLLLLSSIPYIKVAGFTNKNDSFYLNYPWTGAYHGESTTIWTAGDASEYPAFPVEIISGIGEIRNYERKSNLHTFIVAAVTDVRVKDNTTYYPGWRVYVDGKEADIQFQDPNHRGLITFGIPKGEHGVEVKFGETVFRFTANLISLSSMLILVGIFLFRKRFDSVLRRI